MIALSFRRDQKDNEVSERIVFPVVIRMGNREIDYLRCKRSIGSPNFKGQEKTEISILSSGGACS